MKIGNLDIGRKLFLAPMAEVTDSSFRKICKENGTGFTFTQMVSALGVIKNNFETLRLFSFSRSEKPIGVQILGNDPGIIGEAVKEISKMGPDLIDLNCGCPVEKVTANNFGSALLDNPKIIGKIVKSMVDSASGIPISIKIRLGKDRTRINALETAKEVEENGGSLIFVHARTRADKYDVAPDLSWIKKVKDSISIPVVGNGSLFTPSDVKNMIETTGCDSAMIARGALGNPFLFSRFNQLMETEVDPGAPDFSFVVETILNQINNLELEFGEIIALDKAKKHTIWYFKNYSEVDSLLDKVFSIKDLNGLRMLIKDEAEKDPVKFYNGDDMEISKKFQKKVLFWLTDESVKAFR
jgi:tRNA-dihydrouridine synthase B